MLGLKNPLPVINTANPSRKKAGFISKNSPAAMMMAPVITAYFWPINRSAMLPPTTPDKYTNEV